MNGRNWDEFGNLGSTTFGDGMRPVWKVGVIGRGCLKMPNGPGYTPYARTIGGGLTECGILSLGGGR